MDNQGQKMDNLTIAFFITSEIVLVLIFIKYPVVIA